MMLKIEQFGGAAEAVSPRSMDARFATKAVNCKVGSGSLEPINSPLFVEAMGAYDTIYRYQTNKWFTWTGDVDVARSPIAYDTTDRVYFTGTGYPKQTRTEIVGSTGPYPENSYRMGVPAPDAPSINVTGTPDPEQEGLESTVYYIVSAVTAWGEEGPPSDPSTAAVITDQQEVTVTLPTVPTGNYNFGVGAVWRVYRSNSGSQATAFQYLTDVVMGTASFLDTTSAAALGEVIPSVLWDAPPDDDTARYPSGEMKGLRTLPSGAMVGFSGNTLVYSEPYLPHAWPYSYPIKDTIVGIEVTSAGVLVTTTDKPVLAVGLDPQAVSIQELDERRACVSKRSMVDMGEYAIYSSPDGLVGIANGTVNLLTEGLFTREQWQRFKPESIHAYRWEGAYVAFYDNGVEQGGFVFKPSQQQAMFVEIDTYASAGYYDPTEDTLYVLVGTDLMKFDHGTVALATWQSKEFQTPQPTAFSALQVHADNYPIDVTVTRDGNDEIYTVTSSKPMRIAAGRAAVWQVKIETSYIVHDVALASSMRELANG